MSLRLALAVLIAVACAPAVSVAGPAPGPTIAIALKDHKFTPAAFDVPAGVKVRIELSNLDAATEEFDSHDLQVEELVTPRGHASFSIGPLKAGAYSFMGEFHPATAQGRITAVQARP